LIPPVSPQQIVYVIADSGVERSLYCELPRDGRVFCVQEKHQLKPPFPVEVKRTMALETEDAIEFDDAYPDAMLAVRFDARKHVDGVSPSELARLYCRLNLTNVGPGKWSVHQIVPCDKPWGEQAARLRVYIERLFGLLQHPTQ
jgi:hypothetical protein